MRTVPKRNIYNTSAIENESKLTTDIYFDANQPFHSGVATNQLSDDWTEELVVLSVRLYQEEE